MARVEIFTSARCNYCDQAKELLRDKGVEFRELDVSQDRVRALFVERLPRVKAVPQIFINGDHIGGFEDLQHLERSGELDKRLASTRPINRH